MVCLGWSQSAHLLLCSAQAFAEYKTRGPVILKPSDTAELIEKLEDSQMQLGSMATNRYSAPFREQLQSWIVKLSTVSEIIEQWLMVQNMWMYMEAVFSGGDIVKQLPLEAKRFQNIDKNYMKVCMLPISLLVSPTHLPYTTYCHYCIEGACDSCSVLAHRVFQASLKTACSVLAEFCYVYLPCRLLLTP